MFKSLSKSYAIVCNLVKGDSHILIRFSKVWTQVLGKLSPQFLRIRLSVFKLRDLVSKILSNIVSKVQNLCKQQVLWWQNNAFEQHNRAYYSESWVKTRMIKRKSRGKVGMFDWTRIFSSLFQISFQRHYVSFQQTTRLIGGKR